MATSSTITKKSDDAIRKDVASELEWDPVLAEQDIGVAVKDGVVTLAGSVPSLWMKTEAEKAAKRVYGVRGVANDIQINLTSKRTDSEIARDAVEELDSHFLIPSDKIKVTVRQGWVTLEGEVRWQFQKKLAESEVRKLEGVMGAHEQYQAEAFCFAREGERTDRSGTEAQRRTGRPPHHRGGGGRQGGASRKRAVFWRKRRSGASRLVGAWCHASRKPD